MQRTRISQLLSLLLVAVLLLGGTAASASSLQDPRGTADNSGAAGEDILAYIHNAWHTLRRSMNECPSFADPKLGTIREATLDIPQQASVPASAVIERECHVRVERLPKRITQLGDLMPSQLKAAGLLYLPHAYVVPGGRFNEMYGWDSYFIIRGLLEDGERDLARGMIENFFYEIDDYGAVLNANRTYYLTRSQPPFLTSMILEQYAADEAAGRDDHEWLARAYEFAKRDHAIWMREPKLAGHTGLSRYFDVGEGPVPEIADNPGYYAEVAKWLVEHPQVLTNYLASTVASGIGPELRVAICDKQPCAQVRTVRFTADYYKGDRAMRESGFDVSFRFGPFGGSTHHYAPVCLNSLLYKAEMDLAKMANLLGVQDEERRWQVQARRRKRLVNRYLWNSSKGMFFDYDFRSKRQSSYVYATTFYPLWVGLATAQQAEAVMRSIGHFEHSGGLAMSDRVTGMQWDEPYGWAPVQMIAIEGMRRYGFRTATNRVSKEFLTTVLEGFQRDGTIREKYNVVTGSAEVNLTAGYRTNVVGFGWTNGAFLVLLRALPAEDQKALVGKAKCSWSSPVSLATRSIYLLASLEALIIQPSTFVNPSNLRTAYVSKDRTEANLGQTVPHHHQMFQPRNVT